MSTNWLISTGSVSSYPASMVNFIWFTDEKCSSCQHLATWRHKIRCLAIQKLIHLVSGVCWCTVFLKGYSLECVNVIILGIFVATMLKLQQFVVNKPDKVCHRCRAAIQQVCQHWLQQASLYSQHTMTSALRHY